MRDPQNPCVSLDISSPNAVLPRYLVKRFAIAALALCSQFVSATHAQQAPANPALVAAIIRGADTYTVLQLLPTYQQSLGKPITQPLIEAMAAAIAQRYADDGYARPEMTLDGSQLAGGIVTIEVSEAVITDVVINGKQGPHAAALAKARGELIAMKPLHTRTLQRILRRVRELNGLQVTVNSKRDATRRNGHVLTLDARFDAWTNSLRFTNRGTDEVGRNFLIGQSVFNEVFGSDLQVGALFGMAQETDEFLGGGLFVTAPVAGDTRATLLGFTSDSDPTEQPFDFNLQYRHDRLSFGLSNGWQSIGPLEYKTSGAFELDDLFLEQNGVELQADRGRVISLGTQFFYPDDATQYLLVLGLRQGLDALGAGFQSVPLLATGQDVSFTIGSVQAIYVLRMQSVWQARVDAFAQYSDDILSDRERFKIGGDRLGRGFDVPAITGDKGVGAKVELRRDLPLLTTRAGTVSGYANYDIGVAWRNQTDIHQSGASAGLGMTLQGTLISGSIEAAKPLTHPDVDGNRDTSLFIELSVLF